MTDTVYSELLTALRSYQTKANAAIIDVDKQADFNTDRVTNELASIINSLAGWDADTDPADAIANLNTVLEWTRTAIIDGSLNPASKTANGLMTPAHVNELEAVRLAIESTRRKINVDDKSTYIVDEKNIDFSFGEASAHRRGQDFIDGNKIGAIEKKGTQLVPFWVCGLDKFLYIEVWPMSTFKIVALDEDFRGEQIAIEGFPPDYAMFDFDSQVGDALKVKINLTYPISDTKFLVSASFSYISTATRAVKNKTLSFIFDISDSSINFSSHHFDSFEAHAGVFKDARPDKILLKHGHSIDGTYETYQTLDLKLPEIFSNVYNKQGYLEENFLNLLRSLSKGVVREIGSYIHNMSRTYSSKGYYEPFQETVPFIVGSNQLSNSGAMMSVGYSDYAWMIGDSVTAGKIWFVKIRIIRKPTVSYIESKLAEIKNLIADSKNTDNVNHITLTDMVLEGKTSYTNVDQTLTATTYLDKLAIEELLNTTNGRVSGDLSTLNINFKWTGNDINLALVLGNELPGTLKEINIDKPAGVHCNLAILTRSDTQLISGENRLRAKDEDKHKNLSIKILSSGVLNRESLFGIDNSIKEEENIDSSLVTRWMGTDTVIASEFFVQERQDYVIRLEGGILIRFNNLSLNADRPHIGDTGLMLVETIILNGIQYSALFDLDAGTLSVKAKDLSTDAPEYNSILTGLYSFKATAPPVETTLKVANTESVFSKTKSIKFVDEDNKPVEVDVNPEEAKVVIPKPKTYKSPVGEHYLDLKAHGSVSDGLVAQLSPNSDVISVDTTNAQVDSSASVTVNKPFDGNFSFEYAVDVTNEPNVVTGLVFSKADGEEWSAFLYIVNGDLSLGLDHSGASGGPSSDWTDLVSYEHLLISLEWISSTTVEISIERPDGRFLTKQYTVTDGKSRSKTINVGVTVGTT